jgi:hypothetical protein
LRKLNKYGLERTLHGERQVIARIWDLPAGYHPRLQPRIEKAELRLSRWQALQDALREPVSDKSVVNAWNGLLTVDGAGMISEEERTQIATSIRRTNLIHKLEALTELPLEERDNRFLALWDSRLLDGRRDADPLQHIYRQARTRLNT